MTEKCEECGSNDMEMNISRGELVCNECGLVAEHQVSNNQNDNGSAIWGENSFNTPTTRVTKIKTGNKGNGLGSYIGTQKEAKGKWKILRNISSRDAKDCHPMVQATMDAAVRLSGTENAMKAKEVITRATLPIEDEAVLAEMKEVAGDEEVILPKNSVCRMKTRGADTHHNEKLLALGCLRVYQGRRGGMSIDWAAMLENTGIRTRQAGLYEMTPDAHPIIGSTPVDGFYLLTGFSGHGFMQGPVCGKLMAEILIDGDASTVDISMLDYNRFSENRLITEYNIV